MINQAVAKVASKAALDEIVSKLVAHKKNHTGQRVRDNHFSVAYRTLNDVRVDISKDALKQRVSRAIPAQSSAKTINNILNSPSSAVSSIKAPTANTDELEVPPLTPPEEDDYDSDDPPKKNDAGRPKGTTQAKKRSKTDSFRSCMDAITSVMVKGFRKRW